MPQLPPSASAPVPGNRSQGLPLLVARVLLIAPLLVIAGACAFASDAAERARIVVVATQAAVVALACFVLVQAGISAVVQWHHRPPVQHG